MEFLRFGIPPENGKSWNFRDEIPELGVSCYHIQNNKVICEESMIGSITEFLDESRPIFIIKGEKIGMGSDGEPAVRVTKITKTKKEFSVALPWGKQKIKNFSLAEQREQKKAQAKSNSELCVCGQPKSRHTECFGLKCSKYGDNIFRGINEWGLGRYVYFWKGKTYEVSTRDAPATT